MPELSEELKTVGLHNNTFRVCQPQKGGHRPGMDALLLAATIPDDQTGLMADYGAGNGAVGMAVLNRCQSCFADLIERDDQSARLIETGIAHPANQHFSSRLSLIHTDLKQPKLILQNSGRHMGCYDAIVANPPFNTQAHNRSPNKIKADAHAIEADDLEKWVLSANTMLKHGADVTLILRPDNLATVLAAMDRRFGNVRIRPVHSTQSSNAKRILLSATKASKTPLQLLPAFIVHENDGTFKPHAHAIFKGEAGLSMTGS